MSESFKTNLKRLRLDQGFTLRAFCRKASIDPSNYSKVERGILPPPPTIQLKTWLKYLGVTSNDKRYYAILDRAATERGDIPQEVLTPRAQTLLPVLFRTIRSERLTDQQYKNLVKMLEKSNGKN